MTVKELIKKLKSMPQDAEVVMSSDAEGNSHSPVDEAYDGWYAAEATWSGSWFQDKADSDEFSDVVCKSVCIYPVN